MTQVATVIKGETAQREPRTDRTAPSPLRPGWVTSLIVRVLAPADTALSPHDVHRRAEIVHGSISRFRRSTAVSPSSIRSRMRSTMPRMT